MRTMRELVQAYRDGDKMTDEELVAFNKEMTHVTSLLSNLGPDYKIHADHTREIARITAGYIQARDLTPEPIIVARPVSLNQMVSAGVFEGDDDAEDDAGTVTPGYRVIDDDGDKVEGWAQVGREFYVQYRTSDGTVDPDEKCFVVLLINL